MQWRVAETEIRGGCGQRIKACPLFVTAHRNESQSFQSGSITQPIAWGPSINDITQIFGLIGPPSPCPQLRLICSTKSTQPPLLCHVFGQPPSPLSCVTSFMDGPLPCLSAHATANVSPKFDPSGTFFHVYPTSCGHRC